MGQKVGLPTSLVRINPRTPMVVFAILSMLASSYGMASPSLQPSVSIAPPVPPNTQPAPPLAVQPQVPIAHRTVASKQPLVYAPADLRNLPPDLAGLPEVMERRTANSATFKSGPDQFTTVWSPGSLHYRDQQGNWQIINPAFQLKNGSYLVENNSIRSSAGLTTAKVAGVVATTVFNWQATDLGAFYASGPAPDAYVPLASALVESPNGATQRNGGRILHYDNGWSDPSVAEELVSGPDSLEHALILSSAPALPAITQDNSAVRTPDYLEMRAALKLLEGSTIWADGQAQMGDFHTSGRLEVRDRNRKIVFVLNPVVAFEQRNQANAVNGDYVVTRLDRPGNWLVSVRTPWSWWANPARHYPAVLDPTMVVLQSTGNGTGGLAWVTNGTPICYQYDSKGNTIGCDTQDQNLYVGKMVLGSFGLPFNPVQNVNYRGYIQLNSVPYLIADTPVSVTSAFLDLRASSVRMPYYKFDEGDFPDWDSEWDPTAPATVYALGQCPAACNGLSLTTVPAGFTWSNSPLGAPSLGTDILRGPKVQGDGSLPAFTPWNVTTQIQQWVQQNPRPANGPAFVVKVNTNCYSDYFQDDNGKYVPDCTRFVVQPTDVRLRISYTAKPLAVGQNFLNKPGVPSYLKDVFENDLQANTNHQFQLLSDANGPRWRAIAVQSDADFVPAVPGEIGLRLLNQPFNGNPVSLADDAANGAKRTSYVLMDDHNAGSGVAAADLRAEVTPWKLDNPQQGFNQDGQRNYRIYYADALTMAVPLGAWFSATFAIPSNHLIDMHEFGLGLGESVLMSLTVPTTASLDLALVRPTSGNNLAGAVRSPNSNSNGLDTTFIAPASGAAIWNKSFSPSTSGNYALTFINQGRPLTELASTRVGIVSYVVHLEILRCPPGTIATRRYACQPLILPHGNTVGYSATQSINAGGLTIYSEGGFSVPSINGRCTISEAKGAPIVGPTANGSWVAVAQGSVCVDGASTTVSSTNDSGIILTMLNTAFVFTDGLPHGDFPSYMFTYGSTNFYPWSSAPPGQKTGTIIHSSTTPAGEAFEPISVTQKNIRPFDHDWISVTVKLADYIGTDLKAHGYAVITTPVSIDAGTPAITTTWHLSWTVLTTYLPDPGLRYAPSIISTQTPTYSLSTTIASMLLRIISPSFGSVSTADYAKTDGGPIMGQFSADQAKVTHDPKLGGASKNVKVVVLPPGKTRFDPTAAVNSCGDTQSCLDLRGDNYNWADGLNHIDVWVLPDVHVVDHAGTVMFASNGHLDIYSKDHPKSRPGAANDVNESFSFDTFGVSVSVKNAPCTMGGPVVTVITGKGYIALPMLGDDGGGGGPSVSVGFQLCDAKLHEADLTLDIAPLDIPVGATGVGVHLIGGMVTVDPDHTTITITLGFETMDKELLTKGIGQVIIDTRGMFQLSASATIISIVQVSMTLMVAWNPLDILLDADATCCGVVSGGLHLHGWVGQGWQHKYKYLPDNNDSHFSGSIQAKLLIPKGYVSDAVIDIPPFDIEFGIKVAFGEFCKNETCTDYSAGMSFAITIAGFDLGLYIDRDGPAFILGTDNHVLIDQFQQGAMAMNAAASAQPAALAPNVPLTLQVILPGNWQIFLKKPFATPVDAWKHISATQQCTGINSSVNTCVFSVTASAGRALFSAAWENGNLGVSLIRPDNVEISSTNAAYGISYTKSVTRQYPQVLFAVTPVGGASIMTGQWKMKLTNVGLGMLPGKTNNYHLLFATDPPPPSLSWIAPTTIGTVPGVNGAYNLQWNVTRGGQPVTPSTKLELFYTPVISKPADPNEMTGIMIATRYTATLGSLQWDTRGVPPGEYAVGARIDDVRHANGARVFWAPGTVIVPLDSTPPPKPVVTGMQNQKDALVVTWNRDDTTPDLAGYLVEYTIPDWNVNNPQLPHARRLLPHTNKIVAPMSPIYKNHEMVRLGGLLSGQPTTVCVRAYDFNDNISTCDPFTVTLPLTPTGTIGRPQRLSAVPGFVGGIVPILAIRLNWVPPAGSPPAAGYWVDFAPVGCLLPGATNVSGQGTSPIDVGNVTSFDLTGLVQGQRYRVSVYAYDANGFVGDPVSAIVMFINPTDTNLDGIPDAWMALYGLTNAGGDPDHDGLTNFQEYQLGSNPLRADSDGDGYLDGEEANWSNQEGPQPTNVCGPDHPPYHKRPVLVLAGSDTIKVVAAQNSGPSKPQPITIFNFGLGTLNWLAGKSDPWITLGITGGTDLSSLPIGVDPSGLGPGHYEGMVTIVSTHALDILAGLLAQPGARIPAATSASTTITESASINVVLDVLPPQQYSRYLPILSR